MQGYSQCVGSTVRLAANLSSNHLAWCMGHKKINFDCESDTGGFTVEYYKFVL